MNMSKKIQPKNLVKQKQAKHKFSIWKDILNIKAEINKVENKSLQSIYKPWCWFLKYINKIGRPLTQLTKIKEVKAQINRTRNEAVTIIVDTKLTQNILRGYFTNLHQVEKS